jgi:hypothetical protein
MGFVSIRWAAAEMAAVLVHRPRTFRSFAAGSHGTCQPCTIPHIPDGPRDPGEKSAVAELVEVLGRRRHTRHSSATGTTRTCKRCTTARSQHHLLDLRKARVVVLVRRQHSCRTFAAGMCTWSTMSHSHTRWVACIRLAQSSTRTISGALEQYGSTLDLPLRCSRMVPSRFIR